MGMILEEVTPRGEVLAQLGVQKPFVCCGKSFQKTDVFQYLKQFNIVVFDHIRPNPRFEDMVTAAELFRSKDCDFMIGAGGGSPMDSAKMIRLMATNDIATCLSEPMKNNDIKSLFIPTTSGSGSEATKSSVFYLNETEKFSIANYDFLPDYVLLDERLLETVPDYQRKCTCLDALCHAIESYFSVKANEESKAYAEKAIRLFFENKDSYLRNERAGNRGMLMASYFGGKAINLTGTTAAHAMCYNITMNCHTAHGHSVAVGLYEIWQYMLSHNASVNDSRGREYVLNTFDALGVLMGGRDRGDAVAILGRLLEEMELKVPSAAPEQIPDFVAKVNVSRLGNNPTVLEAEDVSKIYKRILCQ